MASTPSSRGRVFSPPFVVAVILLSAAAILGQAVDLRQDKAALPLRHPFAAMRAESLRPYTVAERLTLEPSMAEALGARDYLFWRLCDESLPESDPLANPRLFVTYYSGGRNLVPHVPDQCFLGAGYETAMPHENRHVRTPALPADLAEVPIRVCTFLRTAVFNHDEVTVVYTFGCNGRFADDRMGVRLLINDPRNYHAYFSKVEVQFPGAARDQSVRGAAKLFDKVLPVLLRDHWPDFAAAERAAREGQKDAS